MYPLKQQFARWFNKNFHITKERPANWVIQPKSCQGCLLFLLLFLPFILIFVGWTVFRIFKIYPIVFSTLITRLGIAPWLSLPLLIAAFFGYYINLPLFILRVRRQSEELGDFEILPLWMFKCWCSLSHQTRYQILRLRRQSEERGNFEILPLWLLKCWCLPSYKTRYQPCGYIGINVSGGLIPIILALYQFHRAQPLAILIVTVLVAFISYFLVTVIPGRAIITRWSRFWLITTVAALSAMALIAHGVNHIDVSVAFAGGVLGTTIGADLLHLKDVRPEIAPTPLSIGGAGLNDGIAQCGLCALMIAEWLPTAVTWLSDYVR